METVDLINYNSNSMHTCTAPGSLTEEQITKLDYSSG